jgi:hypothetical protein
MFEFKTIALMGGFGLLMLGAVILTGITVKVKEVIVGRAPNSEHSEDGQESKGGHPLGWLMILAGIAVLIASFTVSDSASGGPDDDTVDSTSAEDTVATTPPDSSAPPTTSVPSDGIVMDSPVDGDLVDVTCDAEETSCWIDASGIIGSAFDSSYNPYVLIAYGDQPANFYVQYDSTTPSGDHRAWTAKAYLQGQSSGEPFLLRVVLVRGSIDPPAERGGLPWSKVLDEQHPDVAAQSADVHVTTR